jgi:hypothetical protein
MNEKDKSWMFKVQSGARRYSGDSKLMQASGGFKNSFIPQKYDDKSMWFGSVLNKNGKLLPSLIMSGGGKRPREVLFITDQDAVDWKAAFNLWSQSQIDGASA